MIIKNIAQEKVLKLVDEVGYLENQIISKTLVQNQHHSITLFSFDKGGEISTHSSDGDALVTVLEGVGRYTIGDKEYILQQGESIVMPANVPHAVYAVEQFKMMLVVIF